MKALRALLKARVPKKEEVSEFVQSVENGKVPCGTFVAQASTAKVFKVCGVHAEGRCGDDCVALKVPLQTKSRKVDSEDARIQREIQQALKDTTAAAHFNRVLDVLPSDRGPVIVLEFEDKILTFHTLADVLQSVDVSEMLWKSINFQLISTLYVAQQKIPGFTHNDTHTENLLVVPNSSGHVCSVVSPKGRTLTHVSNVLLKIIDFGQVLASDPKLRTRDGKALWMPLLGNKMIDFQRFASWVVWDVQVFVYKEKRPVPVWYDAWFEFVVSWLDPRFFHIGDPEAKAQFLDLRSGFGLQPNKFGIEYLEERYGPSSPFGLGDMLDDPYFDEFVEPELRFSAQIKPRR